MDIEKNLFNIFTSFIRDLSKTFPEIKNCLYRNYENCLTGDDNLVLCDFPKLQSFLDKIHKYEKMITDKDEQFFNLELDLLEEISFKRLWEKNISDNNRATLWKYFQTFSIININLKSNEQLKNALASIGENGELKKEDITDKKTAKDLKQLKKLTEEVKKEEEEEVEGEGDLEDMLKGFMDSDIGNIAKEVAESMDIKNMVGDINENSNPMEVMSQLMNPEKMGSIFKNINDIMTKKMDDGEITEDSLKSQAEGMYDTMNKNPLFDNLTKNMEKESKKVSKTEDKKVSKTEDKKVSKKGSESTELSKEEKRAKLKQKLKEKEEKRKSK